MSFGFCFVVMVTLNSFVYDTRNVICLLFYTAKATYCHSKQLISLNAPVPIIFLLLTIFYINLQWMVQHVSPATTNTGSIDPITLSQITEYFVQNNIGQSSPIRLTAFQRRPRFLRPWIIDMTANRFRTHPDLKENKRIHHPVRKKKQTAIFLKQQWTTATE